ncbi:metallophosphoesterase, partial [Streptococcus pneumoniae]|uniref:metallophosphoesterase n=1 Tax=Streptococcus pneumoniae TaxID=1313 RepID=UPI00139B6B19
SVGFDGEKDRLFSVGDLVDRGIESHLVCDWIANPWFHAVRGNHDDFAIRHAKIGALDFENYTRNGGAWFIALPQDEQLTIA